MRTLSEEQKNVEIAKFYSIFEKAGLTSFYNMEELANEVASSPCSMSEDMGTAYKGALLIHINMTIALAQRISKMISGTFQIDETSLLKVCAIMHLSKRHLYQENDNEWEVNNRNILFKFNKDLTGVLKGGERSALEALNRGVNLTPIEFEAIKCLDEESDKSKNPFLSILTTIVRQSNELAYALEKERYRKITEKNI
jgi:hypothetical protein